jgi:aspartate 1-decarboxylase
MLRTVLKSKLHRATVTQCDLNYEGSITIDTDLLKAADIVPYEQVQVLNISNGARIITYAIEGEAGSGVVGINGAAARQFQTGDLTIICTYTQVEDISKIKPQVVLLGDKNKVH